MDRTRRDEIEPYVTRDGSTIREWAALVVVCACVPPYSHDDTVLVEQ